MTEEEKHIPEQEKGGKTDSEYSEEFKTREEAKEQFNISKQRLLNVSNWYKYAGKGTAEFNLRDAEGKQVKRLAQIGDFFEIDIPAPGTNSGEGKDWVQIEAIDDRSDSNSDKEYVAIKVRPASNPLNKDEETAHFFKSDATSTFLVKREGKTVSAEVHGRNELPNTESTGIADTVRNAVVAVGAMLGFSNYQWKSLVKGLLEKDED